jgi:hypothetical protein
VNPLIVRQRMVELKDFSHTWTIGVVPMNDSPFIRRHEARSGEVVVFA